MAARRRPVSLTDVLLQISEEVLPDELELMKKLCYDLQGGSNPLGISRFPLADVSRTFDLVEHDYHLDDFLLNVTLLKGIRNQSKTVILNRLLQSWIVTDWTSANKHSVLNEHCKCNMDDSCQNLQQAGERPGTDVSTKMVTHLSCEFMGLQPSEE